MDSNQYWPLHTSLHPPCPPPIRTSYALSSVLVQTELPPPSTTYATSPPGTDRASPSNLCSSDWASSSNSRTGGWASNPSLPRTSQPQSTSRGPPLAPQSPPSHPPTPTHPTSLQGGQGHIAHIDTADSLPHPVPQHIRLGATPPTFSLNNYQMIRILCITASRTPDVIEAMRDGSVTEEQLVEVGQAMYSQEGERDPAYRSLYVRAATDVFNFIQTVCNKWTKRWRGKLGDVDAGNPEGLARLQQAALNEAPDPEMVTWKDNVINAFRGSASFWNPKRGNSILDPAANVTSHPSTSSRRQPLPAPLLSNPIPMMSPELPTSSSAHQLDPGSPSAPSPRTHVPPAPSPAPSDAGQSTGSLQNMQEDVSPTYPAEPDDSFDIPPTISDEESFQYSSTDIFVFEQNQKTIRQELRTEEALHRREQWHYKVEGLKEFANVTEVLADASERGVLSRQHASSILHRIGSTFKEGENMVVDSEENQPGRALPTGLLEQATVSCYSATRRSAEPVDSGCMIVRRTPAARKATLRLPSFRPGLSYSGFGMSMPSLPRHRSMEMENASASSSSLPIQHDRGQSPFDGSPLAAIDHLGTIGRLGGLDRSKDRERRKRNWAKPRDNI